MSVALYYKIIAYVKDFEISRLPQIVVDQLLGHIWLLSTPCQVSLSFIISQNLLKLMSADVLKLMVFLVAQMVKYLPARRETWVRSPGWEDPLEKEMANHSSILAWKIPWMEEPGRLQSMGLQRGRHDWATSLSLFLSMSSESMISPNQLIHCCPLLILLSVFSNIRVFSNESAFHIRWLKYCSFSFSISSSNEYLGLIFFRIDWFDLGISRVFVHAVVQRRQFFNAQPFFIVQLSHL